MITPLEVPIFVVDDDPGILEIIQRTLAIEGFKNVTPAKSGLELLTKINLTPGEAAISNTQTAQQASVFVFVMDIMLPDMNGLDLCKQIKGSFPDSIVLMISGFDIEDLYKRIIDCDADDFLSKPFNPMELTARLNLLIHKHNKHIVKSSVFANIEKYPSNQVPHIGDDIGDYNVIDCLGWGKSSVVYKVVEKQSNDVFAIKLLTRYALEFEEVVDRFQHEIKIMSLIDHPYVIKFYKMGDFNGCPYILMDYIAGTNLEEYIVTKGLPDIKTIFIVALQTAEAIAEIHRVGILHRDIKLKNIIYDPSVSILKLTDFGIALGLHEGKHITHDGYIVGTPLYMAPELFRGEDSSEQSDLYSLGVTLYQFITGFPPFVGKSNADLYKKHLEAIPKSITEARPEVPQELNEIIIKKCMAKLPEHRPSSAKDVLDAIKKINKKYKIL